MAEDPRATAIAAHLRSLADAIEEGSPLGTVLLIFDHRTGGASVESFQTGDHHRCYGIMLDVANTMLMKAKQASQSRILLPH